MMPSGLYSRLCHAFLVFNAIFENCFYLLIFLPWYFNHRDEKNCAMHRKKPDSWNGPYSSSSFTEVSCSRIVLKC